MLYYVDRFPKQSTADTLVIITHHHHDHIQGSKKSFKGTVLTSHTTYCLLYLPCAVTPLDYYEAYNTPLLTIKLIPNHHCAGSVGIVIHDKSTSQTIGYTGDFRIWDKTPSAVDDFLQHFQECHILYYDDSFKDHQHQSAIPTLAATRQHLQRVIRSSTKPLYIDINRTGLEILFKGWRHQLSVSFHESLSPTMKQVLPLLYPPETCHGPYKISFCHDKTLADIIPQCTACYLLECGKFPICFHNTPDELAYFLSRVPSHIKLVPCGYSILKR